MAKQQQSLRRLDHRDISWYIDRLVQILMFMGGISAIVFIISIFIFIAKEGVGFIGDEFSLSEFFGSINWRPTSETNETYGALALMVGTASITGMAMLIAIPFSL
ncbi:MAG: phosphate ABC transporter permease subunit PstC, partial [Bacteroidetes Order II. Incertae sedis bacterium]|nr:phosphate ABC transporter permease subunit PstC [Bacteroidetes Order II. bacterium]